MCSSAKLSAVATGSKVHVVQNLARPKPTNPFYASSQWNSEGPNAEENEAQPEFHMCKRPTDLKLVSCTSEIKTSSSAADVDVDGAAQDYASSLDSSNPFSSSIHEDETDFASREQGLTVKRQLPHTLITAEAEELIKSEVSQLSRTVGRYHCAVTLTSHHWLCIFGKRVAYRSSKLVWRVEYLCTVAERWV